MISLLTTLLDQPLYPSVTEMFFRETFHSSIIRIRCQESEVFNIENCIEIGLVVFA